jgi:hypothetical protein
MQVNRCSILLQQHIHNYRRAATSGGNHATAALTRSPTEQEAQVMLELGDHLARLTHDLKLLRHPPAVPVRTVRAVSRSCGEPQLTPALS